MTSDSPSPHLHRSPVPHEVRPSPSSANASYHYPPVPPPQHPGPAHFSHGRQSSSNQYGPEPVRIQSSFSSAESSSTLTAEYKSHPPHKQYHYGPMMERGIREESISRKSPSSSHHSEGRAFGSQQARSPIVEDNSAVFQYIQEKSHMPDVEEEQPPDHALWILMWMSFLDPLHCFFSAFYSIFALIVIIVFAPLRLCRKECSPSISLVRMVAPVFRHHLQMIHAKSLDRVHTFEFSPSCLVMINLISPLISFGNAIAAWVTGVFWIFAIIMGNPDGTEKRDDGKASVLGLRDWWERCLLFAVRK